MGASLLLLGRYEACRGRSVRDPIAHTHGVLRKSRNGLEKILVRQCAILGVKKFRVV
jgi:hypothetical protein